MSFGKFVLTSLQLCLTQYRQRTVLPLDVVEAVIEDRSPIEIMRQMPKKQMKVSGRNAEERHASADRGPWFSSSTCVNQRARFAKLNGIARQSSTGAR